jgi:Cytochrome C oxidase subunit II, transmembrane domain
MRPLRDEEISIIVLGMIIGMVSATLYIKLKSILRKKYKEHPIDKNESVDADSPHAYQLNFQDPVTDYMEGVYSLNQHFLVLEVLIVCLVGWLLISTLVLYRENSLRKALIFFHASSHKLGRPAVSKPRSLKKRIPCKIKPPITTATSSKANSSLKLTFKEVFETTRALSKAHDNPNFRASGGNKAPSTSNLFSTISQPKTKTFGGTSILQVTLRPFRPIPQRKLNE